MNKRPFTTLNFLFSDNTVRSQSPFVPERWIHQSLEKPNKFDPFGQKESAHLIYHTIAPLKVLVMGVNFILPF